MPRSFVEVNVLLPIADEEDAENTCEAVVPYLAGKDCRVFVIHVVKQKRRNADTEAVEARAETVFERTTACFDAVGIPTTGEIWYGTDISETILDAAAEHAADSIVLTPRKKSVWRRLLSENVIGQLARKVDQPLIVLPTEAAD
ncbi:universal stress protein [Halohasta litorea]|uniref:Universal stress protein n=1 Tax=Halohasta litorea TaxID=869891 RepID=A0ABD6D7V1_9EURY|nr:universal stress protein [Halohasta litorea]